jgi:hypothetical protein
VNEPEPFNFDPKRAASISVVLIAAGAGLWAITGRVGAGASLMGVGAVLSIITIFVGRGKG